MRLALFFLALLFVKSMQQFDIGYHPKFFNPIMFQPRRSSFQYPYYSWVGFLQQPQNRFWGIRPEEMDDLSGDVSEEFNDSSVEQADYFPEPRTKGNKWRQDQEEDKPSNRLFYNQGANGFLAQQIGFPFKTIVYTTIKTKTIITTTNCIPASLIGRGVTTCARRRRDIYAYLDFLAANDTNVDIDLSTLKPSPLQKIETTALVSQNFPPAQESFQTALEQSPLITSSKVEGDAELQEGDSGVIRAKRLLLAARTTFTSWKFTTTTIPRRISISVLLGGNLCAPGIIQLNCALACIPPDYSIC